MHHSQNAFQPDCSSNKTCVLLQNKICWLNRMYSSILVFLSKSSTLGAKLICWVLNSSTESYCRFREMFWVLLQTSLTQEPSVGCWCFNHFVCFQASKQLIDEENAHWFAVAALQPISPRMRHNHESLQLCIFICSCRTSKSPVNTKCLCGQQDAQCYPAACSHLTTVGEDGIYRNTFHFP